MSKPMAATVSWTQVATASGYKVFWGESSRTYPYTQDVGSNLSLRVKGLRKGRPYYFAAKSYNNNGVSPYSNEVKHIP